MNNYVNVLDTAAVNPSVEKMTEEDLFGQSFSEYIENVKSCSLDDIELNVDDIDTSVFIIDDGGELFRTKSGDYINVCWRFGRCRVWVEDDPELINFYNERFNKANNSSEEDEEEPHLAVDDRAAGQWYEGLDDEGDTDFIEEEEVFEDNDDYINEDYENLIGKKIRIINMDDPYASQRYEGKEGIIQSVETDPWGDVFYAGTWGSLTIYPKIDTIEFIDDENSFDIDDAANKLVAMAKADGKNLSFEDAKEVLDQSFNQDADTLEDFYNRLNFDAKMDEGLFDAEEENINYGHKAWVLNQIISSMNDETAYYDTEWLYIWPDGETEKECDEDFGDKESFEELEDTFKSIYKYNSADEEGVDPEEAEYNFHRDGLYNPTKEAVQVAHEYDKKLGLEPIKVLGNVKESLTEDTENNKKKVVFETDNYNVELELFDEEETFDVDASSNNIDYWADVMITVTPKDNNEAYIMMDYPFNLSKDFDLNIHGGFAPATRWEPAESPDLDFKLDNESNIEFDERDLEEIETQGIDNYNLDEIKNIIQNNLDKLNQLIKDNESYLDNKFYNKLSSDDMYDTFIEHNYDYDPPEYDD